MRINHIQKFQPDSTHLKRTCDTTLNREEERSNDHRGEQQKKENNRPETDQRQKNTITQD